MTPLPFTWISICAIRLEGALFGSIQIHRPDHASHRDNLILRTDLHTFGSFDHQIAVGQNMGHSGAEHSPSTPRPGWLRRFLAIEFAYWCWRDWPTGR